MWIKNSGTFSEAGSMVAIAISTKMFEGYAPTAES